MDISKFLNNHYKDIMFPIKMMTFIHCQISNKYKRLMKKEKFKTSLSYYFGCKYENLDGY